MSDTPQVCKHGSLRRVCETCDLAEDVTRLERELAEARKGRDEALEEAAKAFDGFTYGHYEHPSITIRALKTAAQGEGKKVCDYAHLPHSGGGTDHGQVAHSKGGYNICVKCYDAIIEAEKRESAHYDAARREHGK